MVRRKVLAAASLLAALAGGLVAWRSLSHARPPEAPRWPAREVALVPLEPAFPEAMPARRVFLDAGHGAPQNTGNVSAFCVDEQDFTARVAAHLAARLQGTGRFEVKLSRAGGALVDYRSRVAEAESWGADVFLSLHSDVRGAPDRWSPTTGASCPIALDGVGFSILLSDEGTAELTARRLSLARSTARALEAIGLPAYDGSGYSEYEGDREAPGVFFDRHLPDQRIFVLRKTHMPAILVETHHAIDPREAARWDEPETLDAFASAIAVALASF